MNKNILKKTFIFFLIFLGVSIFLSRFPDTRNVNAGNEACTDPLYPACWSSRWVEQWACPICPQGSTKGYCINKSLKKGEETICKPGTVDELINCGAYGRCKLFCDTNELYQEPGNCRIFEYFVFCDTSPGFCSWSANINDCEWRGGSTCVETAKKETLSCCGPGEGVTPTSPPTCNCSSWNLGGCGEGGCAANERHDIRVCNPAGCNNESRCVNDPSCSCTCTGWIKTDKCCGECFREWENTCAGATCPVPGTSYDCQFDEDCCTKPPMSCSLELLPVNFSSVGESKDVIFKSNENGGSIIKYSVEVGSGLSLLFSPSPGTNVLTLRLNSEVDSYYKITALMSDNLTSCSSSAQTYFRSKSWAQFLRGDVVAKNGDILFYVPVGEYLMKGILGENPGVPIAKSVISSTPGSISTTNINVPNSGIATKFPSYSLLRNKIPRSTPQAISSNFVDENILLNQGKEYPQNSGYYYFEYKTTTGGDFEIRDTDNEIDLKDRKVILFVDGADVSIKAKLKLEKGRGFFMLITNGDISVSPSIYGDQESPTPLPDIEGIYYTEKVFYSGSFVGEDNDGQLHVRGTVVGDNVILQRDLYDDKTTPGEIFEFAPDLILLMPRSLSAKVIEWKEVLP